MKWIKKSRICVSEKDGNKDESVVVEGCKNMRKCQMWRGQGWNEPLWNQILALFEDVSTVTELFFLITMQYQNQNDLKKITICNILTEISWPLDKNNVIFCNQLIL